jgi:2-keto-4-pentenoate hydratase/2-oxohepta-3-ene-1,7-dioic acid hydratase in catechol pathway
MKIIRYQLTSGQTGFASLRDGAAYVLEGDLFSGLTETGATVSDYKLLAPIEPKQLIGIGLNYRQHAEETHAPIPAYPIVFVKFLGALQNPEDPILLPGTLTSDEVDFECELAVVIGKSCRNATRENALDYVFGYTAANDVSARDWQKNKGGSQWGRGKSFDTFCPLGPVLVTADEIPNPNALGIKTVLNGEVMQDWNTNDMIFDVPALIEFLSGDSTLPAGTVILTGTPQGVGMARTPPVWMKDGDVVTIEIEGIGSLRNPVKQA